CVDSDVDLRAVNLHELVALHKAHKNVAQVWMPPTEKGPCTSFGDRCSQALLCASLHAFPLLRGVDSTGAVGKIFSLDPQGVAALLEFKQFSQVLGEDVALATH